MTTQFISDSHKSDSDRLNVLRASADGWSKIQFSVLGFVGICGLFHPGAESQPRPLRIIAALIAVAAFGFACLATYLVGRVAWPSLSDDALPDSLEVAQGEARLERGKFLTYIAIALIVLATLSDWWPKK
jgi:hypothetical protein